MTEKEIEKNVVALVLDLMFAARVRGVAADAIVVRSGEELRAAVGPETGLVLVDLQAPGALEALRALAAAEDVDARVVAWGPHVMEDALAAARGAGAEVMARGAFVKALPELVAASG